MNGLVTLAVACAVAFAGGYGGGWWKTRPAPAGEPPQLAQAQAGPHYVDLGQLVVPVMAGGHTTAFVLAHITLEAAGAAQATRLKRELPHARNALLQGLYGLAANGFFDGSSVDPAEATRRLMAAVEDQFGPGVVTTLLFDRLLKQDNSRS